MTVLIADYPDIVNVPIGATVTITGTGSGTYTTSLAQTIGSLRFLGLAGTTVWGNDLLTFTWNT
jgi:hypothetical protein